MMRIAPAAVLAMLAASCPSADAPTPPSGAGAAGGLTAIAASSIGTSTATIPRTSNVASDSQVDYGTPSAYGATTPLSATPLTAHSVALSGLSAGTVYHFRVRSSDAAGNLAVSGDSTFTTLVNATPPLLTALAASSIGTSTPSLILTSNVTSHSHVD